MSNPSLAMRELAHELANTAEWRREKAEQHAYDGRNAPAARLLDELAEQCLDTNHLQPSECVEFYEKHWRSREWTTEETEWLHDYLRDVGFHQFPDTPEDLCRDLILVLCLIGEAA